MVTCPVYGKEAELSRRLEEVKSMPKVFKTTGLIGALITILSVSVWAAFPKPVGYVNDFAQVIDRESAAKITELATGLREDQGVELAIVTIQSSRPLTPKGYATELFNDWGIGGPEDSGLLILLVTDEREIQVEVGYGLEGVLPDGKVGAILDEAVIPYFSKGEYGKGLLGGTKAFRAVLADEDYETKERDDEFLASFVIFMIIVVAIYLSYRRGSKGPGGTVFRTGPVYPGTIRPRRSSGGPKRGGGGFGGFGGGRSGGGGAGRKF